MPPGDVCFSKHRLLNTRESANPFNEGKRGCLSEFSETSDNRVRHAEESSEESEAESEETVRVTTRARLNYELHKYSMNAMLIVTTEHAHPHLWTRLVTDVKQAFQNFRFHVEISNVCDPDGLYAECEGFFQRDFSDYGAVALAIVTTMAVNGSTNPSLDDGFMFFEESRVVDNFRLDRNPTLADKPKIYITEAHRRSPSRQYHDLPRLDEATYGDVLGFHVPLALPEDINGNNLLGSYDNNPRPLKLLCDKMAVACDDNNVAAIMEEVVHDAKKGFPLLHAIPIEVVDSLSKELFFARIGHQ